MHRAVGAQAGFLEKSRAAVDAHSAVSIAACLVQFPVSLVACFVHFPVALAACAHCRTAQRLLKPACLYSSRYGADRCPRPVWTTYSPDADGDIRSVECLDFLFDKRVICRLNRSCQDESRGAQNARVVKFSMMPFPSLNTGPDSGCFPKSLRSGFNGTQTPTDTN